MNALVWSVAQANAADTPTDWWRLIGLFGITVATIVILALIFRPALRAQPGPNGEGDAGQLPAETPAPGLLQFPAQPPEPASTEASLAAERLRQIINREAEGPPRQPVEARTPSTGVSEGPKEPREGKPMGRGEHESYWGRDAEQAGLDSRALEEEINRLFGSKDGPGKIVPFTPRKAQPSGEQERPATGKPEPGRQRQPGAEAGLTQFPVDTATRDGITATIQELLFCSNVGELLHGFALYTDRYLFQFMDDSRMTEDEFRDAYSDVAARDPADWTRIDAMTDFVRLEDGRVTVRVRYIDGAEVDGTERFVMRYDPRLERWLIDDIQAV